MGIFSRIFKPDGSAKSARQDRREGRREDRKSRQDTRKEDRANNENRPFNSFKDVIGDPKVKNIAKASPPVALAIGAYDGVLKPGDENFGKPKKGSAPIPNLPGLLSVPILVGAGILILVVLLK